MISSEHHACAGVYVKQVLCASAYTFAYMLATGCAYALIYVQFVHLALGNEDGWVQLVYEGITCKCLLIPKSPDAPCFARYLVWVLYYIPYVGLNVSVSQFLVLLCLTVFRIILRLRNLVFRIFNVYGMLRSNTTVLGPF